MASLLDFGDLTRPLRMAVWMPVAFGGGALVYFALPGEPQAFAVPFLVSLAVLSAFIAFRYARNRPLIWSVLMILTFAVFGFARSQHHTQSQSSIFVEDTDSARTVTGWIEAVQNSNGRERIIVRVSGFEGMDQPPSRVRFFCTAR